MSWEFDHMETCPHCDNENDVTACFNPDESDMSGVDSGHCWAVCNECGKDFWFTARLNFEVEAMDVFKKKPKVKND